MTFDHLFQTRPSASDLLSLMSFFDRQGIPDSLPRDHTTKPEDSWSLDGGYDTESLNDADEDFLNESSGICLQEIPRDLNDFLPGQLRMQGYQWNSNAQDDWNFIKDAVEYDSDKSSVAEEFEFDVLTQRDYSLISIGVVGAKFQMHRLDQLGMQEWLKARGEVDKWKKRFISALDPNFPIASFENRALSESLFSHV